nr:hypothetical protein [Tanacetum cinerariifolium]
MIFQALKTWFQTYGVLLKFPMIDMHYEVFLIRENNVRHYMRIHEAWNVTPLKSGNSETDLLLASIRNQIVAVAGESAQTHCVGVIDVVSFHNYCA